MIRTTMDGSPLAEPPQPSLPTIQITGEPEQSLTSDTALRCATRMLWLLHVLVAKLDASASSTQS
jgi:hypothetical protein